MIKNQIPLTFNKAHCPRAGKTWYEPKENVMTTQERIYDLDTINRLRVAYMVLRTTEKHFKELKNEQNKLLETMFGKNRGTSDRNTGR